MQVENRERDAGFSSFLLQLRTVFVLNLKVELRHYLLVGDIGQQQ